MAAQTLAWNRGGLLPESPTATFPYRVLEPVGEGAMGAVFRAEDVELARPVAIKVVRPDLFRSGAPGRGETLRQRLVQEAQAAARLRHPGVPAVHRVATIDGVPYMVMEWVEGTPLDVLLARDGPVRLERAIRWTLEVLDVLRLAHGEGIVHRDIKPGNLMVRADDHVAILDFGIARLDAGRKVETAFGTVLGTPQYAAPEQLAGLPVGAPADLFAVAAVLFELLTGRPPFTGRTLAELVRNVSEAAPPSVHAYRSGLPDGLDDFFATALAKTPDERFGSAEAMARSVQAFLVETTGGLHAGASGIVRGGTNAASVVSTGAAGVVRRVVSSIDPVRMAVEVVEGGDGRSIDMAPVDDVLDWLLDVPLHAPPFAGILRVEGARFFVAGGVVLHALGPEGHAAAVTDATRGTTADCVIFHVDGPRAAGVVAALAAVAGAGRVVLAGLDAAVVRLERLVERLRDEGRVAALVVETEGACALVLPGRSSTWIIVGGGFEDVATVDDLARRAAARAATMRVVEPIFAPLMPTFRRRLAGTRLMVDRDRSGRLRSLTLVQRPGNEATWGEATSRDRLLSHDPVTEDARFLLCEARGMFERFDRVRQWPDVVAACEAARTVHLYPRTSVLASVAFDAVFADAAERVRLGLVRLADGTPAEVLRVLEEVKQALGSPWGEHLDAVVLVALLWPEEAMAAYAAALERSSASAGFSGLLARLSDRRGRLFAGGRSAQVLLVTDEAGRRRPLVFE
ncbi:MAG: serine/threonine protein kinase [Deltaproteobacteria bacterium]|nr:MAG: serine/threonine protein kinase [Deltaproteobacteria bacterium]